MKTDVKLTDKHIMCLLDAANKFPVFGGENQTSQELVNYDPSLLKETSYSGEFLLTEDGKFLVEQLTLTMDGIVKNWKELLFKKAGF
jgi:hypothetical protein